MVVSSQKALSCPKCRHSLPADTLSPDTETICAFCGGKLRLVVFPAFTRPPEKGAKPDPLLTGKEAACFYHADKQAVVACESCGRFLCALCSIEMAERTICTGCIQSEKHKGKMGGLTRRRVLHDEVALSLAVWPLLAWPFTIATAPTAIFWSLRHWNTPTSVLPRTRVRYVLAIILALLQIVAWISVIAAITISAE